MSMSTGTIMEFTMFDSTEPHTEELSTHGEDDHPYGARYGAVLNRGVVRMREEDRDGSPGGSCGVPRTWKSSLLGQGSLQVSRARAYVEIGSNRPECCLAREDIRAIREVPPQNAVSKKYITLCPAIGNLTKQCMVLHPSVGSFNPLKTTHILPKSTRNRGSKIRCAFETNMDSI